MVRLGSGETEMSTLYFDRVVNSSGSLGNWFRRIRLGVCKSFDELCLNHLANQPRFSLCSWPMSCVPSVSNVTFSILRCFTSFRKSEYLTFLMGDAMGRVLRAVWWYWTAGGWADGGVACSISASFFVVALMHRLLDAETAANAKRAPWDGLQVEGADVVPLMFIEFAIGLLSCLWISFAVGVDVLPRCCYLFFYCCVDFSSDIMVDPFRYHAAPRPPPPSLSNIHARIPGTMIKRSK